MNIAQLKRNANEGGIIATMTYRYGEPIPERLNGPRPLVRANSVAVFFRNADGRESELRLPPASLVEYEADRLTIYSAGERDLTPEERAAMDEWERIENRPENVEQMKRDCLTDGNTMYWKQYRFFRDKGMNYLRGFDEERGMKYDWNTKKVRDAKIKGDKLFEYALVRA